MHLSALYPPFKLQERDETTNSLRMEYKKNQYDRPTKGQCYSKNTMLHS